MRFHFPTASVDSLVKYIDYKNNKQPIIQKAKPTMKSSTIAQKLNLSQLMTSLKMLHQQMDQSNQEASNPHFADSLHYSNASISKHSARGSHIDHADSVVPTLTEICRKETHSHWSHGQGQEHQYGELREINRKLFQDNRALIQECIRLRKLLQQNHYTKAQEFESEPSYRTQLKILSHESQINRLKVQNIQLKLLSTNHRITSPTPKQKSLILCTLQQIKNTNKQIQHKIQQLLHQTSQKTGTIKLSRSNTTTMTSKVDDNYDHERQIQNIKVVYEDRIRVLEGELGVWRSGVLGGRGG